MHQKKWHMFERHMSSKRRVDQYNPRVFVPRCKFITSKALKVPVSHVIKKNLN